MVKRGVSEFKKGCMSTNGEPVEVTNPEIILHLKKLYATSVLADVWAKVEKENCFK